MLALMPRERTHLTRDEMLAEILIPLSRSNKVRGRSTAHCGRKSLFFRSLRIFDRKLYGRSFTAFADEAECDR